MDNEFAGGTFGVLRYRFQCPAPRGLDFSSCRQSVAPVILNSRSKPHHPLGRALLLPRGQKTLPFAGSLRFRLLLQILNYLGDHLC